MKARWMVGTLLATMAMASFACGGDDDDDSGAGACAHAQMVCASDNTIEIDCDDFDSAPASIKECSGKAATCDAVTACLFGGM